MQLYLRRVVATLGPAIVSLLGAPTPSWAIHCLGPGAPPGFGTETRGPYANLSRIDSSSAISFHDNAPAADTIALLGGGLVAAGFESGDTIEVIGSNDNDNLYLIDVVEDDTLTLVPAAALNDESGGTYTLLEQPTLCVIDTRTIDAAMANSTRNGVPCKTGGAATFMRWDKGNKVILFEVSGYIGSDSRQGITVDGPGTGIYAQTAPSPGVAFRNISVNLRGVDLVLQHLRIRGVAEEYAAPLFVGGNSGDYGADEEVTNVVVDHCSVSWGGDETVLVAHYGETQETRNVTLSNNIFWGGLHVPNNHAKVVLFTAGAHDIASIQNLIGHGEYRNPVISECDASVHVNNVSYNGRYFHHIQPGSDDMDLVIEGCVTKDGPVSSEPAARHVATTRSFLPADYEGPLTNCEYRFPAGSTYRVYVADNICQACSADYSQSCTGAGLDEWNDGVEIDCGSCCDIDVSHQARVSTRPLFPAGLNPLPATEVMAHVTTHAGARPAELDAYDGTIISQTLNDTGDSSYLTAQPEVPPLAEDSRDVGNGMDEDGLPNLPVHPHADDDMDGWTNLEEWLHELAWAVEGVQPPPPDDGGPVLPDGAGAEGGPLAADGGPMSADSDSRGDLGSTGGDPQETGEESGDLSGGCSCAGTNSVSALGWLLLALRRRSLFPRRGSRLRRRATRSV